MSTAGRYLPHYTIADYEQWQGDWELWQGIPVAMTPSPFGNHQRCSLRLARALLEAVEDQGCKAEVLQEIDWIVSDDTVVRPDILLVCGDLPERHVTQCPAMIAEILSPSTADRDRNEKLRLYEDQGVAHYLIVDPAQQNLEVYVRDSSGKLLKQMASDEYELTVCRDCRISLVVSSVF